MEEPLDHLEEETNPEIVDLHIGWKILAFLIPISGAIMYFVHKNSSPKKSQSACTASLWGIGFGFILRLLTAAMGG